MKKVTSLPGIAALLVGVSFSASAAVSPGDLVVSRLGSFGGGDGWLAPGEGGYSYLGTGNLERGIAFGNGQLYLVSRQGGVNVRRLNALTGADLGGLDVTGIAGGTFAANMVGVASDGAVYVGNLSSPTANFKVYRWSGDGAVPTVAYDAPPGAPRIGDSLAVFGGGAGTRIIASGSTSSGFVVVNPNNGTGNLVSVAGTAAGEFRLGITSVDGNTVIGAQGGTSPFRWVDYDGTTGTLVASPTGTSSSERLISYTVLNNTPLLATVDTANALVRIYDASDPTQLNLLQSINNTSGTLAANGNGVGSVAWAPLSGDTALLYAMSANQGIQAFTVTIPEPGTTALLLLGGGLLLASRRRTA